MRRVISLPDFTISWLLYNFDYAIFSAALSSLNHTLSRLQGLGSDVLVGYSTTLCSVHSYQEELGVAASMANVFRINLSQRLSSLQILHTEILV